MRATYPLLFRNEGTWFCRLVIKWLVYMHEIVHVAYAYELMYLCVEFWDEILSRGQECKTRENSIF